MRSVLIPFDGSDGAKRALQYAIDFVREYGRLSVHLLNVQDEPVVYGDYLTASLLDSLRKAALRAADEVLASGQEMLAAAGIECHSHTALGGVAEQVARAVAVQGCDTVIMGTRGMGAVSNLLMGSVATRVVHLSQVPVLLVK
ncbi:MAG: universal stress protein [Lysobacterales bacterium]|jgi:nucleotide-binding universal stress UspA family protein